MTTSTLIISQNLQLEQIIEALLKGAIIMKKTIVLFMLLFCVVFSQNEEIYPITINEKFPDITLSTQDGDKVSLSDLRGKKVMLIFLRGRVTPTVWCPICQYQYLEMVSLNEKENLKERANMEIFFVLPYSSDTLDHWISAFPKSLESIEKWKNPENADSLSKGQIEWMEYAREFFPYSFDFLADDFEITLPILFDEDRKVSKGLMLFKEEWGGTKVDQNIPTIFIIDEKGYVKFKYLSQYTNDRPDAKYIKKYIEKMF